MTSKKVFYGMIGAVALSVLLLMASVVLGNAWLQKSATTLTDVKLQNKLLEEQQTSLNQAKKDVAKYTPLETIANTIVPQDKDQAKAVRELVALAEEAGIKITGVTFPASTLGQKSPVTATSTATPTTTATTPTTKLTQVTPVTGITGVYQMDLTVQTDPTSKTTYASLIDFLSKLEKKRRTAQVSNINITPNQTNPAYLSFDLAVRVYIKP